MSKRSETPNHQRFLFCSTFGLKLSTVCFSCPFVKCEIHDQTSRPTSWTMKMFANKLDDFVHNPINCMISWPAGKNLFNFSNLMLLFF